MFSKVYTYLTSDAGALLLSSIGILNPDFWDMLHSVLCNLELWHLTSIPTINGRLVRLPNDLLTPRYLYLGR